MRAARVRRRRRSTMRGGVGVEGRVRSGATCGVVRGFVGHVLGVRSVALALGEGLVGGGGVDDQLRLSAMAQAVGQVDNEADGEPDEESNPREPRKLHD